MHPTNGKKKKIQQQHNTHSLKANQFQWETIFIMFCCLFVSFLVKRKWNLYMPLEFPFEFSSMDFPMKIAINKLERALCNNNTK